MVRQLLSALLSLLLLSLAPQAVAQDASITIGPSNYPSGVNPLNGLTVSDPALLNRRPLIIKISNYPPLVRTLQHGVNEADVVWETLLSGGITRFSAVFLSQDLPLVGPIRSGRLVDFELVRIYRALYTYSGMAQGTIDILNGDSLMLSRVVGGAGPCPPLCRYPQDGIALEHTLYGDTLGLRDLAVALGRDVTPEPVYGMAFGADVPVSGVALNSASIRYTEQVVDWEWDAGSHRWLRTQDDEPHVDANDERISAINVVIVEEEHTVQPEVVPDYWGPGDFAFSVNFIGSGRIVFLRDGRMWEGEWRRETREDPLTYFDSAGQPIIFEPGKTWFNLVPRWIDGYELVLRAENPPTATVNGTTGVSMHYGPSELYRAPDVAYPGDMFAVYGRNWNGTWMQVQRGSERHVWLPVERLDIGNLDVITLPLVRPTIERG